ncbi:LysM peptidoglycan-binding domain-containing protein [Terrabacter sp. BE26]|uniref:LysM peptidoglycan-binding domain-containing protein n=1 Tax=Terrabacter sp. BE26 TaxID=2898152 RepID=UPI0035BE830C
MSAIVLEAVREPRAERTGRQSSTARPHLVLVRTAPDAARRGRAAQQSSPRSPMRLTRFGRLVRTLLVASVVALLGVGLAGQLASATGDPRTVTVQSGQTLSGIAARELPELPVADGVVQLQVANSLSTSQVHAGQQLVIPAH